VTLPAAPDRAPRPRACPAGGRLAYLDWLRGLAVLVMIQAHTLDAWTRAADRHSFAYGWAIVIGGMGAPLFLFLAGIAVSLAAGSRAATMGDDAAARSVRRRGWQIFALAFAFRLYSWALSPGAPLRGLLKVDILNIMGPGIVVAAWLWQLGSTTRRRAALLTAATIALAMATPLVRASTSLGALPDALEAYLRPAPGLATFSLLPWVGFVTAGAVSGLAVRGAGLTGGARLAAGCAAAGLILGASGYALSLRPAIYEHSSFWTSSPAFFCVRVGVLTIAVAAAWLWGHRPWTRAFWSPLEVLGASSLFVYWVHLELVYGVVATPLRRALSFPQVILAFALFSAIMLALTCAKDRLAEHLRSRGAAPRPSARTGEGVSS
jgi:uncharacterized membrane protein